MKMKISGEKSEYKQGVAESPKYLMIEPTNRCNLNCRMCSRNELQDIGDMELPLFQHALEQLPEVTTVKFQGLGEAYLAKSWREMLELLAQRNIKIVSITNALWRNIDIPYLMSLLEHMYISYHAADEQTYESIVGMGKPAWELLHKNIKTITANQGNTHVLFNCVLSDLNYHQAAKIVERAAALNVSHVRFQIMQNWTSDEEELHDSLQDISIKQNVLEELTENLMFAKKRGDELGVEIELVGNEDFDYTKCVWPFERTFINKNGDVLPCCMRPNPRYAVGNIRQLSFEKIWKHSEQLNEMRRKLSNNIPPDMCKDCPYRMAVPILRYVKKSLRM